MSERPHAAPPLGALLPPLVAFASGLAILAALTWPLVLHPSAWHLLTPFGDSHTWVADFLARSVSSADLPSVTPEIGYPQARVLRIIGWVPALATLPLRPFLGPVGAAHAIQLLSLPLSGLVAAAWIRARTDADRWTAAALGLAFALGPTALSTFGMQELSNTQVWVFPAFLLALDLADRRPAALPLLALVALAATFSSPYFGLALPLIAAARAAWRLARPLPAEGGRARRNLLRLLRPALLLVAVAAGMAPARSYYAPSTAAGELSAFRPAQRAEVVDPLPFPPPVARPDALLLGTDPAPRRVRESQHVAALGTVLLGAALLLGALRRPPGAERRGLGEGLAILGGGALLALGPWLAWGDRLVTVAGHRVPLPVWLLEAAGYPTATGGLYFRYAVLAEAGLVLIVASLLAGRRRAAAWAWLLLLLHVADGVRASGPFWPRPAEPVPDLAWLGSIRGRDGAVLELPLQDATNGSLGQGGMLRAVIHGRPTTSLPRDVRAREDLLPRLVANALSEEDGPAALLSGMGFRYVIVPADELAHLPSAQARLVARLGAPDHDGALRGWDLGPTVLRPLPLAAPPRR